MATAAEAPGVSVGSNSSSSSSSSSGRPRIDIQQHQLTFLRSMAFTWKDISAILGISVKTAQRRAKEWGIPSYTAVSDAELEEEVRQFKMHFPHCGEALLKGHLESKGIHVQRQRVRQAVWHVSGHQPQPSTPIPRRTYSVPGPNSLWHIDGNHKMIRWRLVIHGGIDGFSRLVTFLSCSSNNRSETVLTHYVNATHQFGVPSRVRTDRGGENVQVWRFMEEVRGEDRSSYIVGSSTHNTRIERLWRDVYTAVTSMFVTTFQALEASGYLDPLNDADLFCLHYVYIPRINAALLTFQNAWNSHPLSTEGNKSPLQLFASHAITDPSFDALTVPEDYGFDPEGPEPDDDVSEVVVPDTYLPLTSNSIQHLYTSVNPLDDSVDGQNLYIAVVQCVYQLMQAENIV